MKDESGQFVSVPQFKILNAELWDLRRTISYTQNPQTRGILRNKYNSENGNQQKGDLIHLSDNVSRFVASKPWIFESFRSELYSNGEEDIYPPIVSELQPGLVLNHEVDVLLVSHLLPCVVKSIDRSKGVENREIISKAKKYGIPSDGSLTYEGRKAASEEIARSLLKMTGKQADITFLNALVAARKRDVPTSRTLHKCHDVSDSLLLALEDCKNRHALLMKNLGKVTEVTEEEEEQPLSFTINDDDDDDKDALFPPKQRKKRAPSLKKRAQAVNDSFDEQAKKRVRLPAKERPKKKARIAVVDKEDTIESDDDEVIVLTKKTPIAKKYKQLSLVEK